MSSTLLTALTLIMLACVCGGMLAALRLLLKHADGVSAAQVEPLKPEPWFSPSSTSPCPSVEVRGQP